MAGRAATRVRFKSADPKHSLCQLEPGLEEGELLLDAESGLILRRVEFFEEKEGFVREVEEIEYDTLFPDNTFRFVPPAGRELSGLAAPRIVTLDTAVALASFPVFRLAHVPADWNVRAVYTPATERPTLPDAITLDYERSDGGVRLRIDEAPREHQLPSAGLGRSLNHRGRRYVAAGPERPSGMDSAQLFFALDRTHIRMASSELSVDQLLTYARLLARV